jgi:hypothetical protein
LITFGDFWLLLVVFCCWAVPWRWLEVFLLVRGVWGGKNLYLMNRSLCSGVQVAKVTVAVNKNELKLVLDKLDTVKLELLRLRAMLLPVEEASEEEKREIEAARVEIAKGSKISLDDLVKELC